MRTMNESIKEIKVVKTSHLRELYEQRDLVLSFAMRDIKTRYKQTVFGMLWAILQPLSMMVIFTMVFSLFAKVPSDGLPYAIFSYSALIFWNFFASALSQGTNAMVSNGNLVRKIYFPREVLLLAVILSAAVDLAVAGSIFLAMLLYYQITPTLMVIWIVPLFACQSALMFGIICVTSALHVNFRDIGHAVPLVSQLWMFATPVAYPLSVVPDRLLWLLLLNPMTPIIEGYRRVILHGQAPEMTHLAISAAFTIACLLVGYMTFKRVSLVFADVI